MNDPENEIENPYHDQPDEDFEEMALFMKPKRYKCRPNQASNITDILLYAASVADKQL